MRRTTTIEVLSLTHRKLWYAAKIQLDRAKSVSNEKVSFYLAAKLLAFFAFEAYLNYLGESICPKTWKNEKAFFSKGRYQGTMGKLDFLSEKVNVVCLDKSRRPYQTIKQLNKFRDFIAHGRVEKDEKEVRYTVGQLPRNIETYIFNEIRSSRVDKDLEDVEVIIKKLHQFAKSAYPQVDLFNDPLDGILESQIAPYYE